MKFLTNIYAAITIIGSRESSEEALARLTHVAQMAAEIGLVLRSGGAVGADSVVTKLHWARREIFIPWKGYENFHHNPKRGIYLLEKLPEKEVARKLALQIHPAEHLKESHTKLMARNIYQITGPEKIGIDPDTYKLLEGVDRAHLSRIVVFAAPTGRQGQVLGGTRLAVDFARKMGIKYYNVLKLKDYRIVVNFLEYLVKKLS